MIIITFSVLFKKQTFAFTSYTSWAQSKNFATPVPDYEITEQLCTAYSKSVSVIFPLHLTRHLFTLYYIKHFCHRLRNKHLPLLSTLLGSTNFATPVHDYEILENRTTLHCIFQKCLCNFQQISVLNEKTATQLCAAIFQNYF